jgi:hypothetical protein
MRDAAPFGEHGCCIQGDFLAVSGHGPCGERTGCAANLDKRAARRGEDPLNDASDRRTKGREAFQATWARTKTSCAAMTTTRPRASKKVAGNLSLTHSSSWHHYFLR